MPTPAPTLIPRRGASSASGGVIAGGVLGGLCVLGAALYVCRRHDRYVKQMSARGGSDNDLSSPLLEMSDGNGSFIAAASATAPITAHTPVPAPPTGAASLIIPVGGEPGSTPLPTASPLAMMAAAESAGAPPTPDAGGDGMSLGVTDAVLEQQEDEAVMNMFENRRALKALAEAAGAGAGGGGGRGRSKGRRGSGRSKQRVPRVQFDVDEQGV